MKKVVIIVVAAMMMAGCGGGATSSKTNEISGSIEVTYHQLCVCFDIFPECEIDVPVSNGKFNFILPKDIDASYLHYLDSFIEKDCLKALNVSDEEAKFAKAYLFAVNDNNNEKLYRGKYRPLRYLKANEYEIEHLVEYVYFDRNVNITGTYNSWLNTIEYNLKLEKGWNVVVYNVGKSDMAKVYTSSVPKGVIWETKP